MTSSDAIALDPHARHAHRPRLLRDLLPHLLRSAEGGPHDNQLHAAASRSGNTVGVPPSDWVGWIIGEVDALAVEAAIRKPRVEAQWVGEDL